jgi:hypothetical protein
VLAASVEDDWLVAVDIAARAGGDPGYPCLQGPAEPAPAQRPHSLALVQTAGWEVAAPAARRALETAMARLMDSGIAIVDRRADAAIREVEGAIAPSPDALPATSPANLLPIIAKATLSR